MSREKPDAEARTVDKALTALARVGWSIMSVRGRDRFATRYSGKTGKTDVVCMLLCIPVDSPIGRDLAKRYRASDRAKAKKKGGGK